MNKIIININKYKQNMIKYEIKIKNKMYLSTCKYNNNNKNKKNCMLMILTGRM